ncbi:MAG: helix-turn-helix domain-containing protein [Lachnospiraceae bacterium]|nr:helix-turn-helix domain-containing protein [Lachnospiraceae bacterium]MBQ9123138.1 helix-turn-helix domain-containing protein [Lachnospiraceae bacterium]
MSQISLLANSLSYIEEHLTSNIKTEDIAAACYCSKSTLEKMFHCLNHISIRDYIVRRRMTLAAKVLLENSSISVLEVAIQYGYSSNEAFTRAFKQVWNCTPAEYRKSNLKYSALFPRLLCPTTEGDPYMRERKPVDISELYDLFLERRNCYFVCTDIKCLVPINEISHKAGDLAILESLNRLHQVSGTEDIAFRIGGDEFTLLTNSTDVNYAQSLADKLVALNGNTFDYEGQEIPLTLHVAVTKQDEGILKYNHLFSQLHNAIRDGKE